tara:strand:+ start:585 stop:794 length:210 start_codon:yes stop_codon:yes gene_type:complete
VALVDLVKNSFFVSSSTIAKSNLFLLTEKLLVLFDDEALFEIRHSSYRINLTPVPWLGNMRPEWDERTK